MFNKTNIMIREHNGDPIAKYILYYDETPSYIPSTIREMLLARYHWRCAICGSVDDLQIDHVIPVNRGGKAFIRNLQVLCGFCNRAKADHFLHYMSYIERRVITVTEVTEVK